MPEYASIVDDAVAYGKGDLELTMVRIVDVVILIK